MSALASLASSINVTTLVNGAIQAVFNGIVLFLAMRYTSKIVDRLEKANGKKGSGRTRAKKR